MKKIFNKKIFIVLGIILIIMILGFIFKEPIKENIYKNKMNNINKDITIVSEVAIGLMSDGGSSPTPTYYYVDLSTSTIYNTSLKKSKKLTNAEIEELKNLTNLDSEIIDNSPLRIGYWSVIYDEKKITLNNLPDSVYDILKKLN